jgi:hypothetical protein
VAGGDYEIYVIITIFLAANTWRYDPDKQSIRDFLAYAKASPLEMSGSSIFFTFPENSLPSTAEQRTGKLPGTSALSELPVIFRRERLLKLRL